MRDLGFHLLMLIFVSIGQAAIISNCIKQFIATEPARNFCLECWDGFYIKQGKCQQCNKYVKNMECSSPKYINSHFAVPSSNISNNSMSESNNNTLSNQSKEATKPVSITGVNISTSTTQIINRSDTNGSKGEIKNLPSLVKIINVIINDNDNINNTTNRCVVYSEIEDKCILCDAGYVLISSVCTTINSTISNKTTNLVLLHALQKSKQLLQTKNQNMSKLIVSSFITQLSNSTQDQHQIISLSEYGHYKMANNTNGPSNESAKYGKNIELATNKGDGEVKIQKVGNNDIYIIKNNSEKCAEYREQVGKQKVCVKCIQGYIINRLQNHCVGYHKSLEVATGNSQTIMKKLANNKLQRKVEAKNNQSTIQDNNNNGNITYDYNATNIDVKIVSSAPTHLPTFSVGEHESIHIVLPSVSSNSGTVEKASISDNSSSVNNSTNVINITAIKMKYNLTTTIDTKTNKTMIVIGTTTSPPHKIDKCIKYREITYTCVQCEVGFTLFHNKCTDNIFISPSTNTSTATKI